MDEFLKSLVGPALVALITLAGTWILNNYKIRKEYQVIYEKELIGKQLEVIINLYKFLQYFTVVIEPDGWYPWMRNRDELKKLIETLENITNHAVWFSKDFVKLLTEFSNKLRHYESDFNILSVSRDPIILKQKDDFTDEIKLRAVEIETEIYRCLIDKDNIISAFKENKAFLEKISNDHPGYKR